MQMFSHKNVGTLQESSDAAKATILGGTNVILSILKSTLGPNGTLKIITGKDTQIITNDGATIMKNLLIDSSSAQLLINTSTSQDKEEGDGTTSVAILAALLVKEAFETNIHPLKIVKGYQLGLQKCLSILDSLIIKDKDALHNLVKTTLSSKVLNCDLDLFSKICVDAISNLSEKDISLINIIKCPGKLEDSFFVKDGFILDKNVEVPEIENPKILVANTAMDYDKIKIFGAKVEVQSVGELNSIEEAEKIKMKEKVNKICFGCNEENLQKKPLFDVFINRQIIYDFPKKIFRNNKVIPVEHADFDGVTRLSNILGATVVSSFYSNVNENYYGTCKKIENVFIGDKRMVKLSGIKKGAGTIVLCGSSKDILEEAERSIHDALCVLRDERIVCGGGSVEVELAKELVKMSHSIGDVESEAILAFAKALIEIPKIIAENCGFDGEKIKSKLRAMHEKGDRFCGIDVEKGDVGDMRLKKIYDSYKVKLRVLKAAVETAQVLIKCDGIVKCKPRERSRH